MRRKRSRAEMRDLLTKPGRIRVRNDAFARRTVIGEVESL
jgi:hypothetical protein